MTPAPTPAVNSPVTAIARLITNLGGADPALAASLRGASSAEIDALEKLAGQPLPAVYREFLQRMGHGMGWLRPVAARFDIDSLRDHFASTAWRAPAGVLKIGLADDDPFFDVYLEADAAGNPDSPRLMRMPRGPLDDFARSRAAWRQPLAGSLPQLLGSSAYVTVRLALFAEQRRVVTAVPAGREIDRLKPLAKALKLSASWFSNDWVQVYDGSDAGLVATQFPGGVLALDVGAASAARCDAIVNGLGSGLGLALKPA